jgi:gamma-glutamyltranspeptidase/glutathione hydrolase
LRLLEGAETDLKTWGHNSADYVHQVTEALKLALADRDEYYGDPLFVDVPWEALISRKYAELRRPLIDPRRASLERRPGDPRGGKPRKLPATSGAKEAGAQRDTTTCLVADRWGNVVAATPSGWGGVVAGDTGVQLGTRLRSLNAQAGHPNCIEPGKRPRITLTPTLVLKDDRPLLAISVAGGDLQDQVTLQLLLNCLEFQMSPADAVSAPRFTTAHHVGSFSQPPPKLGSLTLDEELADKLADDLQSRGHVVQRVKSPQASPCVLLIDSTNGVKRAAGDPKAHRHAGAY